MIRLDKYETTFINVPKTGSTALRNFILANYFTDKDTCSEHQGFHQNILYNLAGNSHYNVAFCIDNKLSKITDTFYATIRHPLEKQLSAYLYRAKQGYIVSPSVHDFRDNIIRNNGFIVDDFNHVLNRPYHLVSQASFGLYKNTNKITWWCYDYLDTYIKKLVYSWGIEIKTPFSIANANGINTKQAVYSYYDKQTIKIVTNSQKADLELYNKTRATYENKEI